MRHILMAAVVCALAIGCGRLGGNKDGGGGGAGGGSAGGSGGSGGDAGADQLNAEEEEVSTGGGDSANALVQLIVLADSLFDFDPTLDTTRTAAENAQAIEGHVRHNLGSADGGLPLDGGATGCGTVSLNGNTVAISFGLAPGCTLRNGASASGSVAVTVTKLLNSLSVDLVLTQMTVNAKSLDGSATFATNNNTSFIVDADVTSGSKRFVANNFSVAGSTNRVTINGGFQMTDGSKNFSMTYTDVTWLKGDCYPNAGTLRTVKGLVATTITFNAQTPATGVVSVSTGRITVNTTLPAYGSCGVRDGG